MNSRSNAEEAAKPEKLLRHVVCFKFKEEAKPSDKKAVEDAFAALPSKIKQISDFEWGTNNSPEMLDQGYTHCFLVTFKSEADREAYLPHPAHKEFVELLLPHLEEAFVIDYWATK
ncbi:Dabb family protein [Blastopirellula sp. JC732]|uniref:Dabb family protein n=1 Tax=Blastopirellula sediminis TaxID=2894196 RepID=A0A9X1MKJ4_9BACT|nr:Dabb family protein [Blastopirellula sediminis]MCC9608702.1 Dabb family protein [Blastopirellula sediminis]MCC9628521.1 Dabb family protein [Blastopirellula sediminis]